MTLVLLACTFSARAQGTAVVTVSGIPATLQSPFVNELRNDFDTGRYLFQVNLTTAEPVTMRFRIELDHNGDQLFSTTSEPVTYQRSGVYTYRTFDESPRVSFPVDFESLLSDVPPAVLRSVVQEGVLPEGVYMLTVEPLPQDEMVVGVPSMQSITVIYPDPATLIAPADQVPVMTDYPVFTWIPPVTVTPGVQFSYDFKLVEMLPNQTPLTAIQGNRPHHEQTTSNPTFLYQPSMLPLEVGKRYAWRVTTRAEVNGSDIPLRDDGKSEIYTFTYEPPAGLPSVTLLSPEPHAVGAGTPPTFSWMPSYQDYPQEADLSHTFRIVPVEEEQDIYAAFQQNEPLLEKEVGSTIVMPWTMDMPSLDAGTYAWAVHLSAEVNEEPLRVRDGGWSEVRQYMAALHGGGEIPVVDLLVPDAGAQTSPAVAFSWLPDPQASPDLYLHTLRVVELEPGADPQQAITGTPVLEREMNEETIFMADPSDDLFEVGKRYAWQVRSEAPGYQMQNGGRSAIRTFTVSRDGDAGLPPVTLMTPEDREILTGAAPMFSWLAPLEQIPAGADYEHTFRIVPLEEGQAPFEALHQNAPLLERNVETELAMHWSMEMPTLSAGSYVWGVRLDVEREGKRMPVSNEGWSTARTLQVAMPSGGQIPAVDLITPENGTGTSDVVFFSWLPDALASADFYQHAFRMVELDEGADPEEAISGEPVFEKEVGQKTNLVVMPEEFDFEVGQQYAWQVRSDAPGYVMADSGRSAVRTFTVTRAAGGSEDPREYDRIALNGHSEIYDTGGLQPNKNGGFDGRARMQIYPNDPARRSDVPVEVEDLRIQEQNGRAVATGGDVRSDVRDREVPFNPTPKLNITTISWNGQEGELRLGAELTLGGRFECAQNTDPLVLAEGSLLLRIDGMIEGQVSSATPCPAVVGPFQAEIDRAAINFHASAGRQLAELTGDATLRVDQNVQVGGDLGVDLISGQFTELDFTLRDPFVWGVPSEEPVLRFQIQSASLDLDGFHIDGRNRLLFASGDDMGVTFDQLTVDLEQGGISSGQVFFDGDVGFEAGIAGGGALDWTVVPASHTPTLNPGLFLALEGSVQLDANGLTADGSGRTELSYDGEQYAGPLQVEFTNDFALGMQPFGVRQGQADLLWNATRIAWVDRDGFHADGLQIAEALLPDRIPLPRLDIAYLQIRRDGDLLVDATREGGEILISSRQGEPLDLVVPALDAASPPTVSNVTIDSLRVTSDAANPQFVSGAVIGDLPQASPLSDLSSYGVPLAMSRIAYERREGTDALYMDGELRLFDRPLDGAAVTARLQSDGMATIDLQDDDVGAEVELVPGSDRALLRVQSLAGSIRVPLASSASGSFSVDVGSELVVRELGGADAAGAELDLRLSPQQMQVTRFEPFGLPSAPELQLGSFAAGIDSLTALPNFSYDEQAGFQFALKLDLDLGFPLADGTSFSFPLNGVELRHSGLHIPVQNIHGGSVPGLDLPAIQFAGVELDPLALRTGGSVTVDWFQGSVQADLSPQIDFSLRLPAFEGTGLHPADGFTFRDVGFADGVLSGSIDTYAPVGGIEIPLGAPSANPPTLRIDEIAGGLIELVQNGVPAQGIDLTVDGIVASLPDLGGQSTTGCDVQPSFSLNLIPAGGFDGRIDNLTPCGELELGPVTLAMTGGALEFGYADDTQRAQFTGTGRATLPAPLETDPDITATGQITYDFVSHRLEGGSIAVTGPFGLSLPWGAPDPLLDLTVNQALIDSSGFMLRGSGNLGEGVTTASVQFSDLTLGWQDFQVQSGEATISSDLAMQVDLNDVAFSMVDPQAAMPQDPTLRLAAGADITWNSSGLNFAGTGNGRLRFDDELNTDLRLEFVNGFAMGVDPLGVQNGRAELYLGQDPEPLAVYSRNGLTLGGGVLAALPDTLGLPSNDVAYAVLRDSRDSLVVNATETAQGWQISTRQNQPLDIVFPSLEENGAVPSVPVVFSLTTDDSFNPTGGSLTLQGEMDLEQHLGLPVRVTSLLLDAQQQPARLGGALEVDLPDALEIDQPVTAEVAFTTQGFEQAIVEVGTYTSAYDPNVATVASNDVMRQFQGASQSDSLVINLKGVRVELGQNAGIGVSGTLNSSLLAEAGQEPTPLFFAAGYQNGDWNASVDVAGSDDFPIGPARFKPSPQSPFTVVLTDDAFVVTADGVVNLGQVIGDEAMEVSVSGLKLGVENVQSSPSLVFDIDQAQTSLPTQRVELFDGAFTADLQAMTLGLEGRVLSLQADGAFGLLDQDIDFTGLQIDTEGQFGVQGVQTDDKQLLGQFMKLASLGLEKEQGNLEVSVGADVYLPAPVDATVATTITLRRDAQQQVQVDVTGPAFDLDRTYPVADIGGFQLDQVALDLDLMNPQASGIYATGAAYLGDDPNTNKRILFGQQGNALANPGIAYSPATGLAFNATSNQAFAFKQEFFYISVGAGIAANQQTDAFEISLQGQATVCLSGTCADDSADGITGSFSYQNFVFTPTEVKNTGELAMGASVSLMDIASLTLGEFQSLSDTTVALPAEGGDPESLKNGDAPTRDVQVERYICFGDCTSGSYSGPALELTLGGQSASEGGTFAGSLERFLFYETRQGETGLFIDGFEMEASDTFSMYAAMQYVQDDTGFSLRAGGGVNIDAGGQEIGGALVGSFSNRNDEVAFGLFAGVNASQGVPIFPGVELRGLGAGMFYRPEAADIEMVHSAMENGLGYQLVVNDPEFTDSEMPSQDAQDLKFAAMLYAGASLGGGVVSGETYIEITSQTAYLDLTGYVMELDGQGSLANASLQAKMFASAQLDEFFIDAGAKVDLDVPTVMTAGAKIEYFMGEHQNQLLWGLTGDMGMDLLGGFLTAEAGFMASNDGFLFEVSRNFSPDVPVITINSRFNGSIWLITNPDFSMPFGAYAKFKVDLCVLGACATPYAEGAFVTKRPRGFELYAAGGVKVDVLVDTICVCASMTVTQSGTDVDLGAGNKNGLVERAKEQQQQFAALIDEMKDKLQGAKDALQAPPEPTVPTISDEDVAAAGANFHLGDPIDRVIFGLAFILNDEQLVDPLPSELDWVSDHVLSGSQPVLSNHTRPSKWGPDWEALETERQQVVSQIESVTSVTDDVMQRLNSAQQKTLTWSNEAETAFDDMLATFGQSPVTSVQDYQPAPDGKPTQSPSFSVDDSLASNQARKAEALKAEMDRLDEQFREAIATVEENLSRIDGLVAAQISGNMAVQYDPLTGQPSVQGGIAVTPGVGDVAEQYATTMETIDRYHAHWADWQWQLHDWANAARQAIQRRRSSIFTGVDELYTAGMSDPTLAIRVAGARVQAIYDLGGKPNPRALAQTFKSDLNDLRTNGDMAEYMQGWKKTGRDVWYTMHDEGLGQLSYQTGLTVNNVVLASQSQVRGRIRSAYGELTDRYDVVYDNKTDLMTTLYGMVDNYVSWREASLGSSASGDSLVGTYRAKRDALAASLQPPTLTNVSLVTNRPSGTYYNEATVQWDATHSGSVIESAIDVEKYGSSDEITVEMLNYLSVGDRDSYTIYPFKTGGYRDPDRNQSPHETIPISVGIRVRSAAGMTALRRAQFDVSVGPAGQGTGNSGDILAVDTTPPSVRLTFQTLGTSEFTQLRKENGFWMPETIERRWIDDRDQLRFEVIAKDLESDVTTFEYAVGSTMGGTDHISWTPLQGERRRATYGPDEGAILLVAQPRRLEMEPGQPYFVSVRVKNGAQIQSAVVSDQKGVIFDPSAPSKPGLLMTAAPMPFFLFGSTPVDAPVEQEPEYQFYDIPDLRNRIDQVERPSYTYQWTAASDPQSGIQAYEYAVTETAEIDSSDFSAGRRTESTSREMFAGTAQSYGASDGFHAHFAGLVSYTDSFYVHVRAVNNAGVAGDVLSRRVIVPDPTAPLTPRMAVHNTPAETRLYLVKPSFDPESDLRGYQYAVGTTPGGTDVLDWTDRDEVQLEMDNGGSTAFALWGNPTPHVTIDRADLPEGQSLYVSYRAVNGQGKASGTRASGPFVIDTTPPPSPTIALDRSGDGTTQLTISDVSDPESGIERIEYKIVRLGQAQPFWTTLFSSSAPSTAPISRHASFSTLASRYTVYVRLTNGNGQQTTSLRVEDPTQQVTDYLSNSGYQSSDFEFSF